MNGEVYVRRIDARRAIDGVVLAARRAVETLGMAVPPVRRECKEEQQPAKAKAPVKRRTKAELQEAIRLSGATEPTKELAGRLGMRVSTLARHFTKA